MSVRQSKLYLERFEIPFDDIDAGGVLYHANYLKYCDRARNAVFTTAGWTWQKMIDQRCVLAVVHVDAEYRRAARQGPIWLATRFILESDRFLMAAHAMLPGELSHGDALAKISQSSLPLEKSKGVHFRAIFKLVPIAVGEFTPASLPADFVEAVFDGSVPG
ncbi:MAG: Acyl-CoA thioesterase [Pseudomonadota bacterium]|jgi:YbgC/YbaW family acyl-CoA thioester hydrolase